jgi:hypothetical protein
VFDLSAPVVPEDGPDSVVPQISEVGFRSDPGEITMTWTTNEPATARVDAGATSAYGQTVTDPTSELRHSVTIPALTCAAALHVGLE